MKVEKYNAIKNSHGVEEASLDAVLQPGNRIILHEEKNEMYHYLFFLEGRLSCMPHRENHIVGSLSSW